MRAVRVRFAPSPTGPLHIGGVRTALYNYLFAKQQNGIFVLRIEDTDQNRYVAGAEDYILETLRWCGIHPDEGPASGGDYGPYRQSERKQMYGEFAQKLVERGHAYYAFDNPEELNMMRQRLSSQGIHSPKYDHSTRMEMNNSLTRNPSFTNDWIESGNEFTIRLKVEDKQEVVFRDRIREEVRFQTNELDDKVLLKADGMPTYHLANVVDDYLMEISHVIRGEEWLSSTAHHVLLYKAFGWEDAIPEFAHLPLILKPSGKGKLSKRDGQKFGFPVFPLEWPDGEDYYPGFRENGFDPEAMLNFLAFLGWNPGTEQEIFSLAQLIEAFSLDKVVKSGARFDYDKALWFNQHHLHEMETRTLMPIVGNLFAAKDLELSEDFLRSYVELLKPRVSVFPDFVTQGLFMFEEVEAYDRKLIRKKWKPETRPFFKELISELTEVSEWSSSVLHEQVSEFITSRGLRYGDVLPLIRIALSGSTKGPDLFPVMELMGGAKVLARMDGAIEIFNQMVESEKQ